jgi:hypothetical protein
VNTIRAFTNFVRTRWGFTIRVYYYDGEIALRDDYDAFLVDTGITDAISAPNVHAQNGATERSGAVLINKATSLKISSNLPESLWPELYMAAGYLLNRSPKRRLAWKTPWRALQTAIKAPYEKPNLAHI